MFVVANLPALVVGRPRDAADITQWTGVDNVPVVLHDDEPARTNWAAIVGLASRLAGPDVLVPSDPEQRSALMGLVELVAGEQGLGWNARLSMIHASFESEGKRGFSLPVAGYLAKRYGHTRSLDTDALRGRVANQLRILDEKLTGSYFAGTRPGALDVYAATFLTPLTVIDDAVCPQMAPPIRTAFAAAKDLLGDLVPARLWAHRTMMFERHLALPIRLA